VLALLLPVCCLLEGRHPAGRQQELSWQQQQLLLEHHCQQPAKTTQHGS
jgi:hypothetical protein